MPRKKLIAFVVVALVAVVALAGVARALRSSAPSPALERALRHAVVRYDVALRPVRPAQLYGKAMTAKRCLVVMRSFERGVEAAATGDAAQYADSYRFLRVFLASEARVAHYRGPDVFPTAWSGRIAYWRLLERSEDRVVVRAAVYPTRTTARWDVGAARLADVREHEYTRAPILDYTLLREGAAWKVADRSLWRQSEAAMYFDGGELVEVRP